jgi:hypothetical protein
MKDLAWSADDEMTDVSGTTLPTTCWVC